MNRISLKFSNIHCDSCAKIVSRKIANIEGVSGISIGIDGNGDIASNRKIEKEEIEKVLEDTEYKIINFLN